MSLLCVGPCRPPEHGGPRQTDGHHLCSVCSERLREDLHRIADAWDDLEERLGTEGSAAMSEKVGGSKVPGIVLNDAVSDAIRVTTEWLWFVARVVVDERDVAGPKVRTSKGIARWLASTHAPWLAAHRDEFLAADFACNARELSKSVRRAAYPSGARRLDLPELRCTEHVTTEEGERVPCRGSMFVILRPWVTTMPDLVCSEDETHRIDPAVWARPNWRKHIDPGAAVALARRLAG